MSDSSTDDSDTTPGIFTWDFTAMLCIAQRHGWQPTRNLAAKIAMLGYDQGRWRDWLDRHPGLRIGGRNAQSLAEALTRALAAFESDPTALDRPEDQRNLRPADPEKLREYAASLRRGAWTLR